MKSSTLKNVSCGGIVGALVGLPRYLVKGLGYRDAAARRVVTVGQWRCSEGRGCAGAKTAVVMDAGTH